MKKGISLIVLVITIIVLAILAGAIIISLSNQNIISQASEASKKADRANAKNVVAMTYAEAVSKAKDGKAYKTYDASTGTGTLMVKQDYIDALTAQGFSSDLATSIVTDIGDNGEPIVATN